jgi:hypothetical protein
VHDRDPAVFYARLPQVKGTAGGVAFLLDEVMPASPTYRGTLNHTMVLDDPLKSYLPLSPRRVRDAVAFARHSRAGGNRGPLYKRWLRTPALRGDDDKRTEITVNRKLSEITKTIRSKNAGVDKITLDVIFPDLATYDLVRESGVLSRETVCRIFGIENGTNHRSRRVQPGTRDQVHDLPADTERHPRRRRHLRQPTIRPTARHRNAGRLKRARRAQQWVMGWTPPGGICVPR